MLSNNTPLVRFHPPLTKDPGDPCGEAFQW